MDVINHPSPNHSARRAGVRVDTVLLHHTATLDASSAMSWLCKRGSGVSAHYVVALGGQVYRLVPEELKAWHAGLGRLPWEPCEPYDFNHRSVGIEIVNPGDGKTPFTEAQYDAVVWLLRDIGLRQGWARLAIRPTEALSFPRRVLGHRDVAPGRKTDPADNFDWARIREALAGPGGVA
jgi:N-acetylmuramoyl-L-alanine amidase